jgi:hypothetical protein
MPAIHIFFGIFFLKFWSITLLVMIADYFNLMTKHEVLEF